MARQPAGEPVRITTVGASRAEDIAARQKRYLWAMGFRTVCFVAAIFVTAHLGPGGADHRGAWCCRTSPW